MATEEKGESTKLGSIIDGKRVKEVILLRGIRRTLAEHMYRSLHESAQLTGSSGHDMTEMIKVREELNSKEVETGIHYTWTDLFVKIVAEALRLVPIMNASLIGREIIIWDDINIGVAVDFEMRDGRRGLIVPVVRNADKKSLIEIHNELEGFKQKGRDGRLMPDDTFGGTFTLTNVGVLSSDRESQKGIATGMVNVSTPIINHPQVGIWGIGIISDTPVAVDGKVVVRPVMYANLTIDHRVLTGADSAMFGAALHRLLLNPHRLLIDKGSKD